MVEQIRALKVGDVADVIGGRGKPIGFVTRKTQSEFFLSSDADKKRVRHGTLAEILEDVAYFQERGRLPVAS